MVGDDKDFSPDRPYTLSGEEAVRKQQKLQAGLRKSQMCAPHPHVGGSPGDVLFYRDGRAVTRSDVMRTNFDGSYGL